MTRKRVLFLLSTLLPIIFLISCGGATAEPEVITVQETVISEIPVTQIVEVTRVVEVEVTRLVEVTKQVVVTATPLPTPRPTATPDAPKVGTRANPVAIGTPHGLIVNDNIEFELTVREVVRGDDALARVKGANRYNEAPPEGFEYVLILLEAAYTGKDNGVLELSKFSTASITNNRIIRYYQDMADTPVGLEPDFDMQLLQGGVGQGWVGLYAAVDDPAPLLLIGEPDTGVFYSLTP